MAIDTLVEIASVVTGLLYVIFATQEKRVAWFYGIISSALAIYLFIKGRLYSESLLYSYYIIAGVYGFYKWSASKEAFSISRAKSKQLIHYLIIGIIGSVLLGYFFENNTEASMPYFDASTTVFSFIATWLAAKKILENWLFWIVIDLASIALYGLKELYLLAGLMFVYSLIAIYGYYQWNKTYTEAGRDLRS